MGLGRLSLVPGAKGPTALERDLGGGLVVKLLRRRHARSLYTLTDRNRDRLRPWLPWVDRVHGIAGTLNFIEQGLGQSNNGAGFQAGIWVDGELAGVVGTHRIDWENRCTGLGYWVDGMHEGRGVVTRSVAAVLDYLFATLHLHRVEIRAATDNQRSRAVPERLGFRLEGVLRQDHRVGAVWQDLAVYGLLRSEWNGLPTVPAAPGLGSRGNPTSPAGSQGPMVVAGPVGSGSTVPPGSAGPVAQAGPRGSLGPDPGGPAGRMGRVGSDRSVAPASSGSPAGSDGPVTPAAPANQASPAGPVGPAGPVEERQEGRRGAGSRWRAP